MGSKPKKYYYVDCGDEDEPMRFNTLDALVNNYSVYVKLLQNDNVEVFSAPAKSKTRKHRKVEKDADEIRGSNIGGNRRRKHE